MTCPFCSGRLNIERDHDLGEGETGGRARARDHRCTTCDVVLAQMRVDKIGRAEERWHVRSPPLAARVIRPTASRAGPCERCGADVIVAVPEGHVPAPAYAIGEMATRLDVRAETRCHRCGATASITIR